MGPASPARPSSRGHRAVPEAASSRNMEPRSITSLMISRGCIAAPQCGTSLGALMGTWLWPHMGSAAHTALVVGSPGHTGSPGDAKPQGVWDPQWAQSPSALGSHRVQGNPTVVHGPRMACPTLGHVRPQGAQRPCCARYSSTAQPPAARAQAVMCVPTLLRRRSRGSQL